MDMPSQQFKSDNEGAQMRLDGSTNLLSHAQRYMKPGCMTALQGICA